eukprot:scaffold85530_cov100-Phaeocystis_antarctica.AAC.3
MLRDEQRACLAWRASEGQTSPCAFDIGCGLPGRNVHVGRAGWKPIFRETAGVTYAELLACVLAKRSKSGTEDVWENLPHPRLIRCRRPCQFAAATLPKCIIWLHRPV